MKPLKNDNTPGKGSHGLRNAIIGALAIIVAAIIPIICKRPTPPPDPALIFSGAIIEATTGRGIGRAEITVVGRNEHYYSEGNGNFRFYIKDSVVRIEVFKDGYQTCDKVYNLPSEGNVIPLSK